MGDVKLLPKVLANSFILTIPGDAAFTAPLNPPATDSLSIACKINSNNIIDMNPGKPLLSIS